MSSSSRVVPGRWGSLRPWDRRYAVNVAFVAIPLVLFVVMAWHRRWLADDGFINLHVVQQLRAGNGPVFNAGERVEVATSPLWVLLLLAGDLLLPIRLEFVAVLEGIVLSLVGLGFACAGAARALVGFRVRGAIVPFGVLVVVALPPVWDFSTSGLENGLSLAWIGVSFWLLAMTYGRELANPTNARGDSPSSSGSRRVPKWEAATAAVVIGLGPLVRPDFVVLSAAFLIALCIVGRTWTRRGWLLLVALVIPACYEVFRMGYYAALVPNTALAKEGSRAWWSQGYRYLTDFVNPYWLWLPIVLLLGTAVWLTSRATCAKYTMLVWLTIGGGILHAVFVVRAGGDFMHGRMFLPALMAICTPIAVLRVRSWAILPVVLVVGWGGVCATSLRRSAPVFASDAGVIAPIHDERAFYVLTSGRTNPVLVEDFARVPFARAALADRSWARGNKRVLLAQSFESRSQPEKFPLRTNVRAPLVSEYGYIGMYGYLMGTDVHVADFKGLASPLASRLRLAEPRRGPPGHEKDLPEAWARARFVRRDASLGEPEVAAARSALGCGELRDLVDATSGPLDLHRFLSNVIEAPSLTTFRFPADPVAARGELCE